VVIRAQVLAVIPALASQAIQELQVIQEFLALAVILVFRAIQDKMLRCRVTQAIQAQKEIVDYLAIVALEFRGTVVFLVSKETLVNLVILASLAILVIAHLVTAVSLASRAILAIQE